MVTICHKNSATLCSQLWMQEWPSLPAKRQSFQGNPLWACMIDAQDICHPQQKNSLTPFQSSLHSFLSHFEVHKQPQSLPERDKDGSSGSCCFCSRIVNFVNFNFHILEHILTLWTMFNAGMASFLTMSCTFCWKMSIDVKLNTQNQPVLH